MTTQYCYFTVISMYREYVEPVTNKKWPVLWTKYCQQIQTVRTEIKNTNAASFSGWIMHHQQMVS